MNIEIHSYEAKTKLPKLLRSIRIGKRYTITFRGEPAAELIPIDHQEKQKANLAIEEM